MCLQGVCCRMIHQMCGYSTCACYLWFRWYLHIHLVTRNRPSYHIYVPISHLCPSMVDLHFTLWFSFWLLKVSPFACPKLYCPCHVLLFGLVAPATEYVRWTLKSQLSSNDLVNTYTSLMRGLFLHSSWLGIYSSSSLFFIYLLQI